MTTPRPLVGFHPVPRIRFLRGQKVLLDSDLAELYGVETKVLLQSVKRNATRFPEDFMFQLTQEEHDSLRSQSVTLDSGRGRHRKFLPYVFTEQGVAMLSSVLRSPRAIRVNIEIMRAFVRLRALVSENRELARRIELLERRYDGQFKVIFKAIKRLIRPRPRPSIRIGFKAPGDR